MAGWLTTHVLDTTRGCPAAELKIELFRIVEADQRHLLQTMVTNLDGRTDRPILPEDRFETGSYELVFYAGDYLKRIGTLQKRSFLDIIPIRFNMTDEVHYHVPLLLSPFGYSTYRGS